ncbi:hypothetical protein F5X96DRAFT_656623 [Biscogniauxia mediterranea]|nr:hypothetical protein F5X96DRAFT_656623 [Biscogniauxia mediterranea]
MDSPYAREIRVAIGAVQAAARISQAVISADDKGVVEKDDLSPVTVADFAIQALLTSTIHAAFPDDRFVGEESAAALRANPALLSRVWSLLQEHASSSSCQIPASPEQMCEMIDWCGSGVPDAGAGRRVWVFDPIDGTKTFVQRRAYAINVALLEERSGRQLLGVVGCPTLPVDVAAPATDDTRDPTGRGLVAFAARGHGAYVRPLLVGAAEGEGDDDEVPVRRIEAHAAGAELTAADLRAASCYHIVDSGVDAAHGEVHARLGIADPGCDFLSWALRWVSLGLGLANVLVWVYRERRRAGKVWDHAGAMLLFEEAGGKITDVDGRDIDLAVGRVMTANYGFVAAPRALHATVLKTVHEVLRDQGKGHLLA